MQALNIDLLIDLARQSPADFESMKFLLIQKAIQSCNKAELGHKLQSAIFSLQRDPNGNGANILKLTLDEMNSDLSLLEDQACTPRSVRRMGVQL